MKKYTLIIAAFVFLFTIKTLSQTEPNDHDTQFWNETTVSFPLIKVKDKNGKDVEKLTGFINGTLRIGQNIRHFVDERIGFGVDYKINKYFSFSPSYLYRAGQPTKNRKEFEHRVRFDFSAEKKWKRFSLKDRNRIEHRIRHSRDDTTRYRNKLTFKVPIKNKEGKEIIAPFIADEVFYDFRDDRWFRNEFSVGFTRNLTKNSSGEFYYMIQNNKRVPTLKTLNVIGVNLKFTID